MEKITIGLTGLLVILSLNTEAGATPIAYNVARNAAVSLKGPFFNNVGSWRGSYPDNPATAAAKRAHAKTVTDGIFMPDNAQWNNGTTWWDSHGGLKQHVVINLGDIFTIESLVVQADGNDAYRLDYRDLNSGTWKIAWNVPNRRRSQGLQTRPDDGDNAERYELAAPILTNALRLTGVGGNKYYAVSEIQAFGYQEVPVPEPASLLLLGTGLAGLVGARVRRRKIEVRG